MMVKFTDDAGLTEEGLDSGGPTREFLTLLMDSIKTRRVFEGKDNAKYLSFDSKGNIFCDFFFYNVVNQCVLTLEYWHF